MTFLDDYSSHCWVVLLKQKSDTLHAIDDFLALVRMQHNALVKQFMTDAGGEYKSFNLSNKFKELGISHQMSVPHMHQQNGRAERLNRTLIEKAQALCFEACLPQSYWEFSVEFTVHVYNRTPVKCIVWRTPFEVLNSTKPNISHLRVFRYRAYVYIPDDVQVNKLAPRAEVMIFLGYTSGTKGFKFMGKPNNVIFHRVTAMFDEHMFPSCPDNISPGSTRIGANYPGTEFDIPLEDRGWFDGGAIPLSGLYPSAGGIPLQQGPPNPGPQQPPAGPPNPLVVPPRPPVGPLFPGDEVNPSFGGAVPAGAPQPSIQPPVPGGRPRDLDDEAVACLFKEMLVHGTNPDNQ